MNESDKPKFVVFLATIVAVVVLAGGVGSALTLGALEASPTIRQMFGLAGGGSSGGGTTNEKIVLEESSAIIDTAAKLGPSVVSILETRNVQDFFGNVIQQKGGGTGFIITSDGLILTNKHVVQDPSADYTVLTSDGKNHSGKVLAQDPVFDLAIVKIEASGLRPVELGNSDDLKIGQWVVAIGNALAEFQNTVTVGVVSAKDRQITASGASGSEKLEGLIQTDAAINPGNSGGPLVNLKGQVVGINTAVAGDAQNIGFAIPINLAKSAIDSVEKTGKIARPMLGIRYLPITKEVADLDKLPVDHGALVSAGTGSNQPAVVPGGPADKAGLKAGDIITKVNNEEITASRSLAQLLQQYKAGDQITLTFLRDTKEQQAQVTLGEAK